jgi:MFS superfamily sulfate permease-like transporter
MTGFVSYTLVFFAGMLVGIIASCILLAQKNLERMQKIESKTGNTMKAAMEIYKAEAARIDAECSTNDSEAADEAE